MTATAVTGNGAACGAKIVVGDLVTENRSGSGTYSGFNALPSVAITMLGLSPCTQLIDVSQGTIVDPKTVSEKEYCCREENKGLKTISSPLMAPGLSFVGDRRKIYAARYRSFTCDRCG